MERGGRFELVSERKQVLINGQMVDVRDEEEYQRQKDDFSHVSFFKDGGKQKVKRMEAVTKQLERMVMDRVDPGASAQIRVIKDEEYFRLTKMYQECVEADRLDGGNRAKRCEYQPLSTYQHKITRARPILKGEVGTHGSQILRLEPGYGEGTLIQVPEQLQRRESDDVEEA